MTTPKRRGAQIWQIYPPVLTSSGQEWQLADLPQICWQIYPRGTDIYWSRMAIGRSTPPPPIEHRCLEYCYTKLGRSIPDQLADLPPPRQLSIDALNTITTNLADLLADLPPANRA